MPGFFRQGVFEQSFALHGPQIVVAQGVGTALENGGQFVGFPCFFAAQGKDHRTHGGGRAAPAKRDDLRSQAGGESSEHGG